MPSSCVSTLQAYIRSLCITDYNTPGIITDYNTPGIITTTCTLDDIDCITMPAPDRCRNNQAVLLLTMNPLYHCLICCLLKFVLSMRKSISSLASFFLLPPPPMMPPVPTDLPCTEQQQSETTETHTHYYWDNK